MKKVVMIFLVLVLLTILFYAVRNAIRGAYFRPEDMPTSTQGTQVFPTLRPDAGYTEPPK
ncbi:hypothetical protein KBC80_00165 [Candidatus Woesebacteria bacterium]|nr:hypothetical protein [Candidatus Woesebacteria bacterium]